MIRIVFAYTANSSASVVAASALAQTSPAGMDIHWAVTWIARWDGIATGASAFLNCRMATHATGNIPTSVFEDTVAISSARSSSAQQSILCLSACAQVILPYV
jgi:hypothetical protein